MVLWGHAPNSQTRMTEMKKAMEKLDMLVVIDPFPTVSAVCMTARMASTCCRPTQFETYGSVTASNRSIQWRDQVIDPLFESKTDHEIIGLFAKKFGFHDRIFRNIALRMTASRRTSRTHPRVQPRHVDGRLHRSVAGADQAAHGQPAHVRQDDAAGQWRSRGWRLLRYAVAVLGHAEMKHPGTPNLYDMSKPVAEGGLSFRARFGVERDGREPAGRRLSNPGAEIQDGYPEFTMQMLMDLGWDGDLTDEESVQRSMLSLGRKPTGRPTFPAASSGWPSSMAAHPSATPRPARRMDLPGSGAASPRAALHQSPRSVADYPTYEDRKFYRLPTLYASIQKQDFSRITRSS
jgi:formate dehydrogenase major subunit